MAGKRGGQVLAPILSDFKQVDKAMETMEGAAGSADKEMGIIRDSLEFKINEIKQTWVGVLQDIADRGGLGKILDGLNKISSVLGDIVSSAGLIRTAFVGLATFVGSKKLGLFNTKDSGTLFGAIAQTHNTKKELSGYEDDIDTYKKVIEHLQQSSDSKAFFNMDIDSMENTSDRVKEKLKEIKDIADETKDSSSDIIECINDEIGNVETSIDETSKKTTALGNSIKGFFKGLLNGLISMGASMLLSWGISEGIKAIDKLINKSKYIQQAAKKARDAIASIKTELDNTSKSVDETKQRYAELAQEVNHLGTVAQSQGTLSNDEYKEFLDLSNQLSELFPTLTQGYDDNGNAILKLSGDVDTIVGSLERLVEVEREAANAEIGKKMPKVWAGFVDDIENETAKLYGSEEHLKAIREQNFSISSGKITNPDQKFGYLDEAANIAGVKINLDDIHDSFETTGEIDLSFLEIEDREKLAAAFKVIENNWDRQVRSHEAIIESKSKEMYDNLITQFVDDDNYKNLTEEQQKIFNGMLLNIDYKKLVKDKGDNYEAAFNEIQTQINTVMDKITKSPENQKAFEEYYEKIFSIDTSEGVFAENIEQIKQYIQELADMLGIEYIDLANIFGLGNIDADINKAKDAYKVGGSLKKDISTRLTEYSKGGKVDLNNRPKISTQELKNAGWDNVGDGYATVFTETFGNEKGTKYINFTPIIVDPETGEYKGVLTPDELTKYAEEVIAGSRVDNLNLQIGSSFTSVEEAEKAAEAIHKYHEIINDEGNYASETELGYISFDPRKLSEEQALQKEYEDFIDSLSKSDLDIWNAALNDGKIDQEILRRGEEGLKEYLKELQKVAENNPIRPKASDAVDSMADMHTALESLSDLYGQTVLQESSDKLATFAADPAMLNSIESAFAKFSEELKAEGNDAAVNEINEALNNFEKVAVESYGDPDYAKQMQDAIDQLITSYIDETDVIKNLTEENKEWSIEQLKAKGITNAEEVVLDRLTKTQKVSAKSWSKLTDAIDAYNDALSRNDTAEAEKQIENLTKSLNEMVGDDTGITFNTEFVKDNISLIEDFINEVDGAREKLQQLAAQQYILNLTVEGDNSALDTYRNQLVNLINQFDGSEIQIGASLDNHPVLRAFIEMAEQAGLTARDIQNVFAAAGVKAVFKYKRIPKEIEAMIYKSGGAKAVGEYYKKYGQQYVESLTYEPISKASTANYSSPSTTGDSSGGGGGGGSEPTKPKEEAEESFRYPKN